MLITRDQLNAFTAQINPRYLPWFNVVQGELTLSRLARLSLFQVSVGICFVLLNGTLNRIMVVELGRAAWLVSAMLALPLLLAPARVLIGYRSDNHRSFLGYRRLPYLWMGTMGQFGGLALMPFVLILMTSGEGNATWLGFVMSLGALLMVGAGMHVTQTAGLALATDLATEKTRHQVVTMLYLMLLVGMIIGALGFSVLLEPFSYFRLIQVIQGSALVVAGLNIIAMWQMEPRRPDLTRFDLERPTLRASWLA
ncbi:MAG: PucC family protein, partial [Luminiphilus sp.]|nr:PucC family protein [Luminiphilus sp.]